MHIIGGLFHYLKITAIATSPYHEWSILSVKVKFALYLCLKALQDLKFDIAK